MSKLTANVCMQNTIPITSGKYSQELINPIIEHRTNKRAEKGIETVESIKLWWAFVAFEWVYELHRETTTTTENLSSSFDERWEWKGIEYKSIKRKGCQTNKLESWGLKHAENPRVINFHSLPFHFCRENIKNWNALKYILNAIPTLRNTITYWECSLFATCTREKKV